MYKGLKRTTKNQITTEMECPICYIVLESDTNYTITSCKHAFCMKCFISCVLQNNLCPCCRTVLYEQTSSESDHDSYTTYDENDDDEYTDTDETYTDENTAHLLTSSDEQFASIDEINRRFESAGIHSKDLIQLIIPGRAIHNTYDSISMKIKEIVEEADYDTKLEYYERQIMEAEDHDSYCTEIVETLLTQTCS